MFNLGTSELIVIFAIILLIFGGKRLPELARAIGQAIQEFRKSLTGKVDEVAQKPEQKPKS